MLLADGVLDEVVVDGHDQHFHHADKASGALTRHIVLLVPTGATEEDGEHDKYYNPYLKHTLGDAQIPRTHATTVGKPLINLTVLRLVEIEALVIVTFFGSLFDARGTETMPCSRCLTSHNDRQGNADMGLPECGNVPFVGVCHVAQHDFLHVNAIRRCRIDRGRKPK